MQSDFLDNKIKEAADHHHPAYDEQAWKRMEKLLDKHLPQKEDNNRRFLFILLIFALLGGGTWLLIDKPWKNEKQFTANDSVKTIATPVNEDKQQPTPTGNDPVVVATDPVTDPAEKNESPTIQSTVADKKISLTRQRRVDPLTVAILDRNPNKQTRVEPVLKEIETVNDAATIEPVKTDPSVNNPAETKSKEPIKENANISETTNKIENKPVATNEIRKEETFAVKSPEKNKKSSKAASPFFMTASAGPDFSFAGSNEIGHTRLLAGIGAGYTFNDRFTIRTGFYTGRKIYSALPGDYNPPPDFWTFYPYLEKVDANCKVYEIPLNISYNFARTEKQRFFASAGVSSYLMKEETYNYFYKYTPTSPVYEREYKIENENKHFLSVLTLSAGYKRNLSKRVFVAAEPYLKLPFKGLGYGRVKLNSGGVMFTVGVRPFNASSPKTVQK